ncbi:MAG: hypothetical protein M1826_004995 [Phylliscum demangeonii]|nr:MAG: hypothetical protein M1826_004995 [Phylliscum demangeonii]
MWCNGRWETSYKVASLASVGGRWSLPAGARPSDFPLQLLIVIPGLDSLQAHSAPNVAVTGFGSRFSLAPCRQSILESPGSTVERFDRSTQATAIGAVACTVQVTGTKADTAKTVRPELINFAPPSVAETGVALRVALRAALAFASFFDISSVALPINLSSIPAAQRQTSVLYIDDVVHTNYH